MVTKEERKTYVQRARDIYKSELLPRYKETHEGRYIVIDGRSGDHEIEQGDHLAYHRLVNRQPNAVTFSTRVGKDSAGRITSLTFGTKPTTANSEVVDIKIERAVKISCNFENE